MTNPFQQSPYLRQQRNFPYINIKDLAEQSDLAYIDVATKVNDRTIGLFALNQQIVTGEKWYLSGPSQSQQTLRKLFTISSAGSIAHGINPSSISGFTRIYGAFTDGSGNYYPLPYVDTSSITNQISLSITSTNIVITAGAGAPTIASGFVIIEWLSVF